MDLDPDTRNWALEHLLGQPLEDRTFMSLLRSVPLPKDNPHFTKLLLLKKLESNISSSNSILINSLDLLEQLAWLEFQSTNTVSDKITQTYFEAAVECTVKHLKAKDVRRFDFIGAVNVIWEGKVPVMKKFMGKGGLGSEAMWAWGDYIQSAKWDDDDSILNKSEGFNGEEAIKSFIKQERQKMGPSFLEDLADTVKTDTILQGIMGLDKGLRNKDVALMSEFVDPNDEVPNSNTRHPQDNDDKAAPPTPNKKNENDCNESMDGGIKKRRRRNWSVDEEDALRTQVAAHGQGKWKLILDLNRDKFQGRSSGNLKDKWRNMMHNPSQPRF